jgi:hypothetical protein
LAGNTQGTSIEITHLCFIQPDVILTPLPREDLGDDLLGVVPVLDQAALLMI